MLILTSRYVKKSKAEFVSVHSVTLLIYLIEDQAMRDGQNPFTS